MSSDDEIDDILDEAYEPINDAEQAGKELGEGKQKLDQAQQDAEDPDQDTASKASNVTDQGTGAMRDVGQALDALGIGDPGLAGLASDIDDFTEDLFGKKQPPPRLPPVRYRVYFGKQDALTSIQQSLFADGLDVGDGLIESAAKELDVESYLGDDPVSSFVEGRGPFADDPAELRKVESQWQVVRVHVDEGLSELFRCELLLVAPETRDADLEDAYAQADTGGGLLDQVMEPIQSAKERIDAISKAADDEDPDRLRRQRVEAELAEAREDLRAAEEQLATLQAAGVSSPSDGRRVLAARERVRDKERELAALRAKQRDHAKVFGIAETLRDVAADPLGAAKDLLLGGAQDGWPDAPVFINIPLDPADFLGQTCSLRITREFPRSDPPNRIEALYAYSARWLTGVVTRFDDLGIYRGGGPMPDQGQRLIRIVVEPSLAKLALRRDCRVFQEMSVLEIVREVFRAAGVYGFLPDLPGVGALTGALSDVAGHLPIGGSVVSDAVSGQFIKTMPPPDTTEDEWTPEREHCVQYNETDLAFVRRLLEEEGIHFTFQHRRGFERLVLLHDPSQLDEAPTIDGRPVGFYWPSWDQLPIVEVARDVTEQRRARPAKLTLRDFCFSDAELAATDITYEEGSDRFAESMPVETYHYPARFPFQYLPSDEAIHYRAYDPKADRSYARLRLESETTSARFVTLRSDVIGIDASHTLKMRGFRFRDQTRYGARAELLVVRRVRHVGTGATGAALYSGPNFPPIPPADQLVPYENEVVAQWIDHDRRERTPCRPARVTPRPRISSLQTATVVDYDGDHDEDEGIHIDDRTLCRVRVRFHWDRKGEMPLGVKLPLVDRGTSCWVRVTQAWAGDDFGVLFVPRIGSEVLVAFENGDPDRPIVVGCLYDGEHPVPVDRRERSTLHTRTSPWDEDEGRSNVIAWIDEPSKEKVVVDAGRYLVEEVRGEHVTKVGGEQERGEQKNEVARHHGEIVEGTQSLAVVEKRTKVVHGSEIVTVGGSRVQSVGADQVVLVTADNDEQVGGVQELLNASSRTLTIEGERYAEIGEPGKEPAHDRHEIGGTKTDTITGTLHVRAGALAVGQPSAPGSEDTAAGIAVGESDGQHAVRAQSEETLAIEAGEDVTIESENDFVDILAGEEIVVRCGAQTMTLGTADTITTLVSDLLVRMETPDGRVTLRPGQVRFEAEGSAKASLEADGQKLVMKGTTCVVTATTDVDASACTTKFS